jgi:CBS domain-containing protein
MPPATNVAAPRLTLWAETAADLMMPNPRSIRAEATVHEAILVLTDYGFSAAPVIDEAGRPVGVLSRADILVHERELGARPRPAGGAEQPAGEALVRDIMTPAVFAVAPDTPAAKVVEQLLALKVHRLFVVEEDGTLVGVIGALDVLRHLQMEVPAPPGGPGGPGARLV